MLERIVASYLAIGIFTGIFVLYYLFFTENGKNDAIKNVLEQLRKDNNPYAYNDQFVGIVLVAAKVFMVIRYIAFWPEFIYLNVIKKVTKKD